MEEQAMTQLAALQKKQAVGELLECNNLTSRFGLSLSQAQVTELVEARFRALKETGRVEFGPGILKSLIEEFCDSPYLTQQNYQETLFELQDSFYYFKNECEDRFSDEELIGMMKCYFDGWCQGSLDCLNGTTLPELCRRVRDEE